MLLLLTDAAGNFLCPASSLSFNAFKTVLEIDTMGTFNTSKVVYEKWFQVQSTPRGLPSLFYYLIALK